MINIQMIKTIDMKHMRYINLFEKVSGVHPKHCFVYNSAIVFVVPKDMLAKVIRDSGRDLKKMSEILGRKIKVAILPNGLEDAEEFISAIVHPVQIKSIEVKDDLLIINAGPQNKAILIGRNKARLEEMKPIVKSYFGKEIRIV